MRATRSRILSVYLFKIIAVAAFLLSASNSFAAPPEPVNNRNVLRVVMDDNYPPYVFKSDQGQLKGIIIDQWGLWEKKTGIHIEITGMDWAEAQRRMQAGEFDVIDTIFRNEKREKIYDFTKPYAVIPVPLFFNADISGIRGPEDVKGFLVAAKSGGNVLDVLRKYGVTNIVEYPSYVKIIEAARDGKVKVFTVDRPPALYFLNKMGIQDHFRETAPLYSGEFHRAVLKGKSDLLTTVEKGFADITPAEYRAIDKSWMGTPISSSPYFRNAGYAGAVVAVFVVGLLLWLRLLNRAVARKTAELSKSEERLSLALNASKTGLWDWNVKNGTIYFDSNYYVLSGYEPNDFPCSYDEWEKRVHPDDVEQTKAAIEAYLSGTSKIYCVEFRFKNKDGSWLWILDQGKIFEFDEQGSPVRFTGTHTDISERKQIEENLIESRARFQAFYELGLVGLAITSPEKGWLNINDCLCNMLGYSEAELREMTWEQLTHPEDLAADIEQFERVLSGEIDGYELDKRFLTRSGSILFTKLVVRCVRKPDRSVDFIVAMVQDLTKSKRLQEEREELENQVIHAQKMESLGVLAGGIAHDFNNILAIIMGNCSLAKKDAENAGNYIPEIEKASDRAAALCRQMLSYAGKATLTQTQVNMWLLINEMINMLKATIPQNTVIKPNLSPDIAFVTGDASQIRQIAMNLIINASEAIGDDQGEIQVSLSKTQITTGKSIKDHQGKEIPQGEYACLEVTDNGCGMNEETKWRIFEPFYTTKFTGRGLGMSAVLGIITAHNGALQLYSQSDLGTTFKVYLPCESAVVEPHMEFASSSTWQGSGSILLVEDEESIRAVVMSMLEMLGFTVIEACDGKEALALYQKNASDITLVVTDMGLPFMDGYALFRELKKLTPELPIIISSGFGDSVVTERIPSEEIAGLVSKPYGFDQLQEVLKSVVEGAKLNQA